MSILAAQPAVAVPDGVADDRATLPGLLRFRAATTPDRLALREKVRGIWKPMTWGTYFERVRAFALWLRSAGFGPGDKLVIASDGTPEWFIADFAAQSLGGVTVGIYPTNPWPELQYIVRHSRAKVAVCGDQEQTDKVLEACQREGGLPELERIVTVDTKGMRHYSDPKLSAFVDAERIGFGQAADAIALKAFDAAIDRIQPSDDALIIYTSGTTGMPKGARISHRGIIKGAYQFGQVHKIAGRDLEVLCYLPLCHVAERLMSPVMQLVYGGVVNFAESIDAVTENLREIGPSFFFGVPRIWEKLQHHIHLRSAEARPFVRWAFKRALAISSDIATRTLDNQGRPLTLPYRLVAGVLHLLFFKNLLSGLGLDRTWLAATGGAALSPTVILFFRALGVPIYQIFGMTETSGATHLQHPGSLTLGSSGPPVPGVEQKLGDDGELLLRGRMVFNGYLYDDAASATAIVDGWLHTGDIVQIDPGSGAITVVDRKKSIIITSGGKNITPSLIENALKDSVYIAEAVLLGEGRNFISALIQIDLETVGKWAQGKGLAYTTYETLAALGPVRELIEADVRRVNERFSRVENIRKFVILRKQLDHDDGELTATMKVRRRVIESKFAAEVARIYGHDAQPTEA